MNTTGPVNKVKAHKGPNYFAVFVILAIITAVITTVELFIHQLNFIPTEFIHIFYISMAVIKATLVAMFYMHLKFDSKVYTILFGMPVLFAVILVTILVIV